MSDIIITTHDALGNDHKGDTMRLHGKSVPGGFAGYIPQNAGFAVCHECAIEEFEDELRDDMGGLIYGDSETDYPGMVCDECGTYLDTYLLVYQSQDPELYYRLRMTEELGGHPSDEVFSFEQIDTRVAEKAYQMGWEKAAQIEGMYGEGGVFEDSNPEVPTDSANWANNLAPKLRALSGYVDGGHGTYQQVPVDNAHHLHQEVTLHAFHQGYHDRAEGEEFEASLEV